ncbi:DUF1622 domain-containing protein [Nonomuraea sp. NPDC050022]|uniref:DUF1622 domain-containing protein n=1 Tax=unclassified Nonomuraea TaxID=2593643 RepID=UPI0033FFE07A
MIRTYRRAGERDSVQVKDVIELIGTVLDIAGVAVIAAGLVIATITYGVSLARSRQVAGLYQAFRRNVGRSILLGLEFLVGADIIKTVAVSPTFQSVGVLAIIVAVRTFLSVSLQVELDGRWPWQPPRTAGQTGGTGRAPASAE